jgi:hypothetical protein
MQVFPSPLRRFVKETAASQGCPRDFVAVGVLATCAVAIGGRCRLELKPGWHEGCRLWFAAVGDPGSGKSPSLKAAMAPLEGRQRALFEEWKELHRAYRVGMARHGVERAVWRNEAKERLLGGTSDIGDDPELPAEPLLKQVLVGDSTMEALVAVLAANPDGALVFSDELVGWIRSFNSYRGGRGADRQAWLSLWSGGQIVVNRKSLSEPLVVDNPFVCILGGLAPDALPQLRGHRVVEDGLVERILFAWPDPLAKKWTEEAAAVSTLAGYLSAFDFLCEFAHEDPYRDGVRIVRLDSEARAAFSDWADSHYAAGGSQTGSFKGAHAKAVGTCARLVLLLHAMRVACRENPYAAVDREAVDAATTLTAYFLEHGQRVHAALSPVEMASLDAVAEWIRSHGGATTVRELQRANVAGVKTRDDAIELLERLQTAGYEGLEPSARRRTIFTLRPSDTRHFRAPPLVESSDVGHGRNIHGGAADDRECSTEGIGQPGVVTALERDLLHELDRSVSRAGADLSEEQLLIDFEESRRKR